MNKEIAAKLEISVNYSHLLNLNLVYLYVSSNYTVNFKELI